MRSPHFCFLRPDLPDKSSDQQLDRSTIFGPATVEPMVCGLRRAEGDQASITAVNSDQRGTCHAWRTQQGPSVAPVGTCVRPLPYSTKRHLLGSVLLGLPPPPAMSPPGT